VRRLSGLFWIVVVLAAGATNFVVKSTVQGLDDELANVRRKTIAEQKETHELTADWTFLNQPELLADLNRRYVGLVPMSPKQVETAIDAIPLRPVAPPPPAPAEAEPQVAAATPPAPQIAAETPTVNPAPAPAARTLPPAPAANPTPPPIVRVAAVMPPRPVTSPSLDALFAQVAGDR
jgi:hypothetical protein